ncbi:MAG TPA: YciI family protein [Planctomycetota bacterium]
MISRPLLLLLPLLLTTPACRAPAPAPEASPAPTERRARYTLVRIKTGPKSGQLTKEENERAFAGHFANMERLANERKLLVAGPYGSTRSDPELRGIFVLASANRAEAEAWAATDPTTQAGVFRLELHDLATDAPLLRALEADFAWRERQLAEGKTPGPGDGARPYVLLTAEHGDLARRELGPLLSAEGGVFLLAELDGTRAFALLDAPDVATARERFAPQLENLGAHALDDWFASAQLATLVER